MSGRKRKSQYDPNDPMHWSKDKYVEQLKELGISVKSTWRIDMIRQLYFENKKDVTEQQEEQLTVEQEHVETDHSSDTNIPVPDKVTLNTDELLQQTASALKTSTEAMSTMTTLMAEFVKNKDTVSEKKTTSVYNLGTTFKATYQVGNTDLPDNHTSQMQAEQIYRRQVNFSKGTVYAEDLPKMDYVAPKILEGKDVNLATLLTPKYETPNASTVVTENLTVELSATKDQRLEQNLTLDEFNKAFRKSVNSKA